MGKFDNPSSFFQFFDFPILMRLVILFVFIWPAFLACQSDSAFIRDNYSKWEGYVPMRDGIRLYTVIYSPRDTQQSWPILLNRTPYSVGPYGEGAYKKSFSQMVLARAGYIFVFQDVRGRYLSEGEFVDVRPVNRKTTPPFTGGPPRQNDSSIDEATDTYDTAEWLLAHFGKKCNGKIGVTGVSYPGFYATMAILANHPAIKAVAPMAPVTDWFIGDDFHHNGALMLMDAFSFYSGFGVPRRKLTTTGQPGFQAWNTPDNYDFFLRAGALPNFGTRFGMDTIPFWIKLMNHANYDTFWQARNPRQHLAYVKPAVLTVGGLFDAEDCWGAWNTYKAIENQNTMGVSNKIVMGPWIHGGWYRTAGDRLGTAVFGQPTSVFFQAQIEKPFFDFYLKDIGEDKLPEAYIFETGSNRWTTYPEWPPADAKPRAFYLDAQGTLSNQRPYVTSAAEGITYDEYISDPSKPVPYTSHVHLRRTREYMTDDQRFAARRADVLVYATPELAEDLTATGPVIADLWVSTTGTDADFIVKIIDVFPDTLADQENGVPLGGYQMLVRGEVMRGRYRNSFENPEAFEPGKPTKVRFELPDIAHTFKKGHRLMVQIQSTWFPLVDRNPQQFINIYKAKDSDFVKAVHRIWHSGKYPSVIWLKARKD